MARSWLGMAVLMIGACGGSSTPDAAIPADGPHLDSGSGSGSGRTGSAGIACDAQYCTGSDVCCRSAAGDDGQCEPNGAGVCSGGIVASCDGPEDCGSGACCEQGDGVTACAPSCDSSTVTVCHTNADCPGTGAEMLCCPQHFCGGGCD